MSTSVNNNGQACLVNKLPSYWVNEARTSHEDTDADTQCIGVAIISRHCWLTDDWLTDGWFTINWFTGGKFTGVSHASIMRERFRWSKAVIGSLKRQRACFPSACPP